MSLFHFISVSDKPAERRMATVPSDEGHLELHSLQVLDVLPLEQLLPGAQVTLREIRTPIHQDLPFRSEISLRKDLE